MAKYNPYRTNTGIHIEWFTVRRSTVYTSSYPSSASSAPAPGAIIRCTDREKKSTLVAAPPVTDNSARFLDLDGAVKVRKSGTYEWINANMAMTLSRDDTIRTVGDSQARVSLFDGTEYLVKPDSILVIEEASEDPDDQSQGRTGEVDGGTGEPENAERKRGGLALRPRDADDRGDVR